MISFSLSGLSPSGVMWICFYSSSCLCAFCFSVDTGIPCRYFGTSLVPLQICLGGCFARCDFLYPDWVVSWYLWFSASSAVPADLCFTSCWSQQIVSPVGYSTGSIIPDVWFLNLFVLELSVLSAFIKHKSRIFMHIHKHSDIHVAFFAIYLLFVVSCYGWYRSPIELPKQMPGV